MREPPRLRVLADRNNKLYRRRNKVEVVVTFARNGKSRELALNAREHFGRAEPVKT